MSHEYTLAPLTVGDVWDSKVQNVPEDQVAFYLLAKTTLKNGTKLSMDEFRELPFSIAADLMSKLNLGNEKTPNP